MASKDVYEMVNAAIIAELEKGEIPWRKPWTPHPGNSLRNAVSGKAYRGINPMLLSITANAKGYADPRWLTYRQAAGKGGHIRKGEKGTIITFWKINERDTGKKSDDGKSKTNRYAMLRYYNVFNADQCDGIGLPPITAVSDDFEPSERAESIINLYAGKPTVSYDGGDRAFYSPILDQVHMPERGQFGKPDEFYSTLFHEFTHSTGHAERLNRKSDHGGREFGGQDYSREEMVAEFGAAFLCGETGIINATVKNSAAYIQSWLKAFKGDRKLLVTSASAGQKAADWIQGERPSDKA
jgi:antirestriction protein ArdC